MAKFVIKTFNPSEGCYFIFLDSDGVLLLTSAFYKTRKGCLNGVKLIKDSAKSEIGVDNYFLNNVPSRVLLRAENGKYLGCSEMYDTVDESVSILERINKVAHLAEVF